MFDKTPSLRLVCGAAALGLPFLMVVSVPPVSTFINQWLAAAAVMLWLVLLASTRGGATGRWRWRAEEPSVWVGGVAVLLALSQFLTTMPIGQRILPAASLALAAVVVWVSAAARRDRRLACFVAPLIVALLLAGVLSTIVGAIQVFAPQLAGNGLIAYPSILGRAVGNMRQPNQLSTLLLWSMAAAVGAGLWRGWSSARVAWLLALLTMGVLWTSSRTGLVGIGLFAVWGLLDRRLPGPLRLVMVIGLPLLYAAGWWGMEQWSEYTGRFFYGDDQVKKTLHGDPSSSRGRIWANTLSLIAAHPWAGVGAGRFNFEWSMTPFPDRPVAFFDHSHNLPLQLAVESGIPFALLVLGLLGWAFWRARGALFVPDDREAVIARSLTFMLVVIGVHSLLEYPLWYTYFLFPSALMAGCLCGAAVRAESPAGQGGPGFNPRWVSAACLFGLVGLVWVGRQYYQVAVIFDPSLSIGEPATLEERIRVGQRSILFGHHADYARVTMAERPEEVVDSFGRTAYHLLDTRLMIAYAKALAARRQDIEARHVAARLREFRNPAADTFFSPCREPAREGAARPFQCGPDPHLSADAVRPEVVFTKP